MMRELLAGGSEALAAPSADTSKTRADDDAIVATKGKGKGEGGDDANAAPTAAPNAVPTGEPSPAQTATQTGVSAHAPTAAPTPAVRPAPPTAAPTGSGWRAWVVEPLVSHPSASGGGFDSLMFKYGRSCDAICKAVFHLRPGVHCDEGAFASLGSAGDTRAAFAEAGKRCAKTKSANPGPSGLQLPGFGQCGAGGCQPNPLTRGWTIGDDVQVPMCWMGGGGAVGGTGGSENGGEGGYCAGPASAMQRRLCPCQVRAQPPVACSAAALLRVCSLLSERPSARTGVRDRTRACPCPCPCSRSNLH
jgi:hypothetical protein